MGSSLARRAFKPVYWLYYAALFGRRFPGSAALARRVAEWEALTGRGDAPAAKTAWEEQYRAGRWSFMRQLDEAARYAVIAAFVRRLAPGGAVLDVGCGEGLLVDELRPHGYRRYLGIDVSEAAIAQGASRADATTELVAADAESAVPAGPWDVVVFNESVYYFHNPLATLLRYEAVLAPGGAFVVSTFQSRRADAVVRALLRRYRVVEATTVSNAKGRWTVRVLSP
jgi:2-polyprenyl-3-methyl-5-hydroxy-6-metoxy-1,4-benzoquinol methylase